LAQPIYIYSVTMVYINDYKHNAWNELHITFMKITVSIFRVFSYK